MSTIREQIFSTDLMKSAMKNSDKTELNLLRVIKGEIGRLEDINNKLSDDSIITLLKKMIENLKTVTSSTSDAEIAIILQYLPKQLDITELENIIKEYVSTNNISNLKEIGKVMGYLKSNYGGLYDGNTANNIIKTLIS